MRGPTPSSPQVPEPNAKRQRILLVDDDDSILQTIGKVLELSKFEVVAAANVYEALKLVCSENFDGVISDLHMPHAGDGLTVVSAMRHANPDAITLIMSGHPALKDAAAAIVAQADGVLIKPLVPSKLIETLRDFLARGPSKMAAESVATILEIHADEIIAEWLTRIEAEPGVIPIEMEGKLRTAHLTQLFADLVYRLRTPLPLGTRVRASNGAKAHGLIRRQQGYSAAMLVEESRMLQVSIFNTLQQNLQIIDHNVLLIGVMEISDEVNWQLSQTMASYILESKFDTLPEGTTSA